MLTERPHQCMRHRSSRIYAEPLLAQGRKLLLTGNRDADAIWVGAHHHSIESAYLVYPSYRTSSSVPMHLEYILPKILKNSFHVSVEWHQRHHSYSSPRPIPLVDLFPASPRRCPAPAQGRCIPRHILILAVHPAALPSPLPPRARPGRRRATCEHVSHLLVLVHHRGTGGPRSALGRRRHGWRPST